MDENNVKKNKTRISTCVACALQKTHKEFTPLTVLTELRSPCAHPHLSGGGAGRNEKIKENSNPPLATPQVTIKHICVLHLWKKKIKAGWNY